MRLNEITEINSTRVFLVSVAKIGAVQFKKLWPGVVAESLKVPLFFPHTHTPIHERKYRVRYSGERPRGSFPRCDH